MGFVLAPIADALSVLVEGLRQTAWSLLRIRKACHMSKVTQHPAVHHQVQLLKSFNHPLEVGKVRLLLAQDSFLRALLR